MVADQQSGALDVHLAAESLGEPRTDSVPSSSLSAAWKAVGPAQVQTAAYGPVTGRVTSIAIDPSDTSGNTVYVGTTGGGVWKSVNAAGPAASVSFTPLTDTLAAYNPNAGSSLKSVSLSIGALSVAPSGSSGVILAGTGDPNDATDSYYGVGILRSADGGLTWTLIQQAVDGAAGNHSFFGLGFSGFAWSTSTSGLVVAALSDSAEGAIVNAPDAINSVRGLYYSTDSGATWQMSTIMDGGQTVQQPLPTGQDAGGNAATAVVWNPERQLFLAAVRYHGYYQSADGVTWNRMAAQPGAGLTTTACPTSPGTTGSPNCPIVRGALAVQPQTGDTFAFTVAANHADQGIWQDVCGFTGSGCAAPAITFGNQLNTSSLETGGAIAQGDYNLTLSAVARGTDTLLFAGTVDLFRCSLAGGCTFRNTTNTQNGCSSPAMVAPAQHAIATLANGGPLIFLGNDGGLWRSTDGVNETGAPCAATDAAHFQNLNPALGSLAEVVSFAQDPTDANTLLVGLGANGTAGTAMAATNPVWPQITSGEGGTVAIDPVTPANWYISDGPGVTLNYCGSGSGCLTSGFIGIPTIGSPQVLNDASVLDPPWLLDPARPTSLVIGTCRIWRGPAENGGQWTGSNALSTDLGSTQNATCTAADGLTRSLAVGGTASTSGTVANQGSTVLYAGMAGSADGGAGLAGHIFTTTTGGTDGPATVWTDLANSTVVNDAADGGLFNPGGFDISSVVADPHDTTGATVYATVMGFAGNGVNAPHLYRSTDGGAHWINISSNLPGAPANSVVVDPNDANTLYVAMDTGVYVTSQVSSCSSSNCWSVFGAGLPNAPVVELAAEAQLLTPDGRLGELRAATYGRGLWEIPLVTATTIARPVMTLAPNSLSFATQQVSTISAAQTITVTNTGDAPLAVSSIVIAGDFTETDTCVGATVLVNQSCTVSVAFLPTATGARAGTLTLYGNVLGGQAVANLAGNGAPPAAITLTPPQLVFSLTNIGATSAQQNILVVNNGGTTATLQTPLVTGAFKIVNNTCGTTLLADSGCGVSVVFAPTTSGTSSGLFSITDSAGTQTSLLSGVGTSPATDLLSPGSLSFAAQQLTTASTSQVVTLTNSGDDALSLISANISSGGFTVVNGCGNSLNGHASCNLTVRFVPQALGPQTGVLIVSDQYRSQAIALSGIGIAPPGVSLAPTGTLSFPLTPVGRASATETVTLTNNGGVPLTISNLVVQGDFSVPAGGSTCGSTLAVGAACTVAIGFSPNAAGPRSGSLTVTDSAGNSPQTVSLAGIGLAFTLTPDGSTSVTVTSGASAVFPLLLASPAGVPGTASFACAGAPANSTCVIQPTSAPLGTTTTVSVTIQTGTAAAAARAGDAPLHAGARLKRGSEDNLGWLAMLLPAGLLFGWRSRARRVRVLNHALHIGIVAAFATAGMLALAGCGSGRAIPPSTTSAPITSGSATPSGSYPITVSATSAGLTQTIGLTLIVQ